MKESSDEPSSYHDSGADHHLQSGLGGTTGWRQRPNKVRCVYKFLAVKRKYFQWSVVGVVLLVAVSFVLPQIVPGSLFTNARKPGCSGSLGYPEVSAHGLIMPLPACPLFMFGLRTLPTPVAVIFELELRP